MQNNTNEISVLDKVEIIRNLVTDYLSKNGQSVLPVNLTKIDKNHIVNIGTSILCTKWQIGQDGGGFVRSVVDNDLMGAMSRADSLNVKALKFYCQLMYNVGMPRL